MRGGVMRMRELQRKAMDDTSRQFHTPEAQDRYKKLLAQEVAKRTAHGPSIPPPPPKPLPPPPPLAIHLPPRPTANRRSASDIKALLPLLRT
jgi:hypothetical protein